LHLGRSVFFLVSGLSPSFGSLAWVDQRVLVGVGVGVERSVGTVCLSLSSLHSFVSLVSLFGKNSSFGVERSLSLCRFFSLCSDFSRCVRDDTTVFS
jgi:hypothetical protein